MMLTMMQAYALEHLKSQGYNYKEKKYRVSIEWIDGQGWKPVKLEVLNSLEGYE